MNTMLCSVQLPHSAALCPHPVTLDLNSATPTHTLPHSAHTLPTLYLYHTLPHSAALHPHSAHTLPTLCPHSATLHPHSALTLSHFATLTHTLPTLYPHSATLNLHSATLTHTLPRYNIFMLPRLLTLPDVCRTC